MSKRIRGLEQDRGNADERGEVYAGELRCHIKLKSEGGYLLVAKRVNISQEVISAIYYLIL